MATWQFDFHLIPLSAVERRSGEVPLTITAEEFDRVNWWEGLDLLQSIEHEVSKALPREESWSTDAHTWGQKDGDRIDILHDGGKVVEVYGRLDVRTISLPFLNRVLDVARKHRLLLLTAEQTRAAADTERIAGRDPPLSRIRVR